MSKRVEIPMYDFERKRLRDEFAASVIAECVSSYFRGAERGDYQIEPEWPRGVAMDAYRIADAMLAEREREE